MLQMNSYESFTPIEPMKNMNMLKGKGTCFTHDFAECSRVQWRWIAIMLAAGSCFLHCQPRTGTISQNNLQGIWNNF